MANSITGINDDIISQSVLHGYTKAIAPLLAFATDFTSDAAQKGDRISVMRDNSAIDAPLDKVVGSAYTIQDADSDAVEIVLDNHPYVSWGLDDIEVANSSVLSLERFGMRKGNTLAVQVLQDIWSSITAANFGTAGYTGAASAFDEDDIADIGEKCDLDDMPEGDRWMVLNPAFYANLLKSGAIKDQSAYGFDAIISGQVPMVNGFKILKSNAIPGNAENLTGFATDGAGIVSAFRYLQPQQGNKYDRAEAIVGEGGQTLGLRDWYSEDYGNRRTVIEALYGHNVGISTAVQRIVTA